MLQNKMKTTKTQKKANAEHADDQRDKEKTQEIDKGNRQGFVRDVVLGDMEHNPEDPAVLKTLRRINLLSP